MWKLTYTANAAPAAAAPAAAAAAFGTTSTASTSALWQQALCARRCAFRASTPWSRASTPTSRRPSTRWMNRGRRRRGSSCVAADAALVSATWRGMARKVHHGAAVPLCRWKA
eukprot:352561-Chlamydomonas_euryale.AAC.2